MKLITHTTHHQYRCICNASSRLMHIAHLNDGDNRDTNKWENATNKSNPFTNWMYKIALPFLTSYMRAELVSTLRPYKNEATEENKEISSCHANLTFIHWTRSENSFFRISLHTSAAASEDKCPLCAVAQRKTILRPLHFPYFLLYSVHSNTRTHRLTANRSTIVYPERFRT